MQEKALVIFLSRKEVTNSSGEMQILPGFLCFHGLERFAIGSLAIG